MSYMGISFKLCYHMPCFLVLLDRFTKRSFGVMSYTLMAYWLLVTSQL